jgi:protease-4
MDQWVALDLWLDEVYADFTSKASNDRSMAYERLEPLARGRVWTGADAAERGLVDELGGRRRALELACELAGLDPERVKVQPVPHVPWMERLKPAESTASAAAFTASSATRELDDLRALLGSATGPESLLSGLADLLDGTAGVGVLSAPLLPRVR